MIKQDMPPSGGYAPITYKRVPIKSGLSGVSKLCIGFVVHLIGGYFFFDGKNRANNDRIEMRCSRVALSPMLEAESDRMYLKQIRRNRDAEEEIMKDVEGWEVGKYKGSRVFVSIGPDEYFKPNRFEYYAHSPDEWHYKAYNVQKNN